MLSNPIGHGPPSIIASIFPEKEDKTSSNLVKVNLPEKFADGHAIGKLLFLSKFLNTGCAGTLTAIVDSPANAFLAILYLLLFFLFRISVRGPGQNFDDKS